MKKRLVLKNECMAYVVDKLLALQISAYHMTTPKATEIDREGHCFTSLLSNNNFYVAGD